MRTKIYFAIALAIITLLSNISYSQSNNRKIKFYGFVRTDFYYNSRQNVDAIDGVFQIFPKPIFLDSNGFDLNATSEIGMVSVRTRTGINYIGNPIWGAKSSAKIEADFSGYKNKTYLFRLRKAFVKLDWNKTTLLIGQTFHPLYTITAPTLQNSNAGVPFQPFNRSPQISIDQKLTSKITGKIALIYQMQYTSSGEEGKSNKYLKEGMLPNIFFGIDYQNSGWKWGVAFDSKSLKVAKQRLFSNSASVYMQYKKGILLVKGKTLLGQNLSDMLMPFGYVVSKFDNAGNIVNHNNISFTSNWLNVQYGKRWKWGFFGGYMQQLSSPIAINPKTKKPKIYDNGTFGEYHIQKLLRISPQLGYSRKNIKIGLSYIYDLATFEKIKNEKDFYSVDNHRITASVTYSF